MTVISYSPPGIFIKTHKVAGTSIEVHLGAQLGPDAMLTPIWPPRESHKPRNHSGYWNHMSARLIRQRDHVFFARAYKFAFERHPIDKTLSFFAWLLHGPSSSRVGNPKTWHQYLDSGRFPVDAELYTDENGRLIIDRIYRYEELDDGLQDIANHLHLSHQPLTVMEKSGYRREGVPTFQSVLADATVRNLIMDAFAPTLKHINY